jgi:hypothetical protein
MHPTPTREAGQGALRLPGTLRRVGPVLAATALLAACELQEVSIAAPEDVLVAEVVLRAGVPRQFALLHRTLPGGGGAIAVPDARIEVTTPEGRVVRFAASPTDACVSVPGDAVPDSLGSCYASPVRAFDVVSGRRYQLRIQVGGG